MRNWLSSCRCYGHLALVAVSVTFLFVAAGTATAVELRPPQLLVNGTGGEHPDIDGTKVVYEDNREGNWEIFVYDLVTSTERRLTFTSQTEWDPRIDGEWVVYQSYRNGNADIYAYNLSTNAERPLTTDPAVQELPVISGTRVVWTDLRSGNRDLYLFDLATGSEQPLRTRATDEYDAEIDGTNVVYDVYNTVGSLYGPSDIYLFDLETGVDRRLTSDPNGEYDAVIDGGTVAYTALPEWHVHLYDLATGGDMDLGPMSNAAIDGGYLIYMGAAGLTLRDLTEGTTQPAGSGGYPSIDGSRLVYPDGGDIYVREIVPPEPVVSTPASSAWTLTLLVLGGFGVADRLKRKGTPAPTIV